MSAKQIAKIEKDLSLARAEIDRLVKELAGVKKNDKSVSSAKSQKKTAAPAKKKAAKPAPVKARAQPKKLPAKKAPAPKKAAPAKKSTQQSKGKLVGDFNDKAYLQEILKLAKQLGTWTGVISALNANGYVTVQGNPIPMNNFTRDLGRRLKSNNAELKKLTEQIFAILKK